MQKKGKVHKQREAIPKAVVTLTPAPRAYREQKARQQIHVDYDDEYDDEAQLALVAQGIAPQVAEGGKRRRRTRNNKKRSSQNGKRPGQKERKRLNRAKAQGLEDYGEAIDQSWLW